MHRWINAKGEVLKTRTIKEFSEIAGIRYSNACSLACGHYQTLRGWLSPKAPKARRTRFLTPLRNAKTGERVIVGPSISTLSKRIGVGMNDLWKVVNGYGGTLAIKGWMLESTYSITHGDLGDGNI